jgi:transposase
VRGLELRVRFILTGGRRNDITEAHALIDGLSVRYVLADTAYDAGHFRDDIAAKEAQAVNPSHSSRVKFPLDEELYNERHLVECSIDKLKHFPRVATRRGKLRRHGGHRSHRSLVAMTVNSTSRCRR